MIENAARNKIFPEKVRVLTTKLPLNFHGQPKSLLRAKAIAQSS
jgi:hypothetical protein